MDPEKRKNLSLASRMVYYPVEPLSKSVSVPIYMASNFEYDAEVYQRVLDGERKAVNIYSRCGNPSEYAFDDQMALIENADACLAVGSGMAAIATLLFGVLKAGDHIVSDWTTYSTTHEFFDHRFTDFGVTTTFVDTADLSQVRAAIRPNTKMIYFETIANPTMKVADVAALVELAHSRGLLAVCDNTFASPYIFRPHDWGVDFVVESATKWIGGHNDALGGTITMKTSLRPPDFMETIRWSTLTKLGGALSPFNAWLLLRGIQTLHVRMEQSVRSALLLARHLEAHPGVQRVWYPGLESHPQHAVAARQMPKFGAMLTFEVGDEAKAVRILDSLELCTFGASLGGVRTTTQVPATMAFLDVPPEEKARMNIRDGMCRVSVGLEDPQDIIEDFDQALARI
jgi:methionine-gamma-lyase